MATRFYLPASGAADGSQDPAPYVAGLTSSTETGTNAGHTVRLRQMKNSSGTETTDLDVVVTSDVWPQVTPGSITTWGNA